MNGMLRRRKSNNVPYGPSSGTFIGYPIGIDEGKYSSIQNPSSAFAPANSSSYCAFYSNAIANDEAYIYLYFDTSGIPANAIVDAASVSVKVWQNGFSAKNIQVYSGAVLENSQTFSSSATKTFDLSNWSVNSIKNLRVKAYGKTSTTATDSGTFRVYGATLTVEWRLK